jgi:hypothetical protein
MDNAKLEALIEEATAACYDEEEAFWALFSTLLGRISYPLEARVRGEAVTLVGLDEPGSGLDKGVMARIQKGGQESTVALVDVEAVSPDPASGDWLAAYRYWLGTRG